MYGPDATKLYAGKITNNVVQGTARIVMTDGIDNSSTTYTKASLKALIAQKKLEGWKFQFPNASLA